MSSDIMTPAEVADAFRVDPRTVTRWTKQGRLPYFTTLGGHRRFYRADVTRLLEQQDDQGGGES